MRYNLDLFSSKDQLMLVSNFNMFFKLLIDFKIFGIFVNNIEIILFVYLNDEILLE